MALQELKTFIEAQEWGWHADPDAEQEWLPSYLFAASRVLQAAVSKLYSSANIHKQEAFLGSRLCVQKLEWGTVCGHDKNAFNDDALRFMVSIFPCVPSERNTILC